MPRLHCKRRLTTPVHHERATKTCMFVPFGLVPAAPFHERGDATTRPHVRWSSPRPSWQELCPQDKAYGCVNNAPPDRYLSVGLAHVTKRCLVGLVQLSTCTVASRWTPTTLPTTDNTYQPHYPPPILPVRLEPRFQNLAPHGPLAA